MVSLGLQLRAISLQGFLCRMQDKLERLAAKGIKPEEAAAVCCVCRVCFCM